MDGTGQAPIGSDRANGVAGLNGASAGNVKGQGGSSSITPVPFAALAVRPEVAAFALAMEERLRANDHKGGWDRDHPYALHDRLLDEAKELRGEIRESWVTLGKNPSDEAVAVATRRIHHEAADVANFAMMVADRCFALPRTVTPAPAPAEVGAVVGGERLTPEQQALAIEGGWFPETADPLSFADLRRANVPRCRASWHDEKKWTPTDWACALAGEVGEACDVAKKLKRLSDGIEHDKSRTRETLTEEIGKELADVICYADLLAASLDVDLGAAVRAKFNEVSERVKSPIRLERARLVPAAPAPGNGTGEGSSA